ncbi:hypothetical protein [Hyphobacterium sp.]|uniref:hypothetical protein n=1 Tax=Hyphobacterium sp. TaxID=2004662 RepID=UPI003B51ED77
MTQPLTTLAAVRTRLVTYIEDAISGVGEAPALERDDPLLAEGGEARLGLVTRRVQITDYQLGGSQPVYHLAADFTVAIQDFDMSADEREAMPDALRAAIGAAIGAAPWLADYHGYVEAGDVDLDTDQVGDAEPEHQQIISLTVAFLSASPVG